MSQSKQKVSAVHVEELAEQLHRIHQFWTQNKDIGGALVSVHYTRVVAKSNRLKTLLSESGKDPSLSIRGAKFKKGSAPDGHIVYQHVFTHYVKLAIIEKTITKLKNAASIINSEFAGSISSEDMVEIGKHAPYKHAALLAKSTFLKTVVDCYYVEQFDVNQVELSIQKSNIVSLFKTDKDMRSLLAKFGIDVLQARIIDDTTCLLSDVQLQQLYSRAPYIIAMSVTDFSKLTLDRVSQVESIPTEGLIPAPANEPVVGVIDTQFDESVYFHEWVEYTNMLPEDIPLSREDYNHGTAVTSIIVDGPKGNPTLEDGCGRFRVRHFGVATQSRFSSFGILLSIREIVAKNSDIKVWNLSLGSVEPVEDNCISPVAAELDKLQSEYDVIFCVAGTNKTQEQMEMDVKVGSPADSLNSLVVNSVNLAGQAASYTRKGPVLSFFHKPDISCFGGDGVRSDGKIAVCMNELGASYCMGTSFATPWITRKLAYLLYIMGLSRELAKALLIDAAARWSPLGAVSDELGYGVVPQHIEDIIQSSDDEIKFLISGNVEDYETYNYNLPVPMVDDKFPFFARATLAYFPCCNRNQGVDYTNTEIDIHFGRLDLKNSGKVRIRAIDNNTQAEEGQYIFEENARKIFRKWDNIKRVCDKISDRSRSRASFGSQLWGISIISKERNSYRDRKPMQFGIVITLKEITGKNRIDEFKKQCQARGWLVNSLDVQNRLDIYAKAEEHVEWE